MKPVHIAPSPNLRVRYVVMPIGSGYAVYRSERRDGRWFVQLETGEAFGRLDAARVRADALAGIGKARAA